MEYGPGVSQFVEPKRHKQKHYPISDLIMLDQERCILCWRCIRYLEEWEDKPQLGLFERGGETVIDIFPGQPVDAKTSGNIIDICPVGALTNRVARFRYRPWEIKKTPSVCTHCPVGCNLRLDERVARAAPHRGPREHGGQRRVDLRQGPLPAPVRGSSGAARRRRWCARSGELRPATWDEALAPDRRGAGARSLRHSGAERGRRRRLGAGQQRGGLSVPEVLPGAGRHATTWTSRMARPCGRIATGLSGHRRHRQERPDRAGRLRSERGGAGARPAHQARRAAARAPSC